MHKQLVYSEEFVKDRINHLYKKRAKTQAAIQTVDLGSYQWRYKRRNLLLLQLAENAAEKGLYGLCLKQACIIEEKRLLAIPDAIFCLGCANDWEALQPNLLTLEQEGQLILARIIWYSTAWKCVREVRTLSDKNTDHLEAIIERHWQSILTKMTQLFLGLSKTAFVQRLSSKDADWDYGFPNFQRAIGKINDIQKR